MLFKRLFLDCWPSCQKSYRPAAIAYYSAKANHNESVALKEAQDSTKYEVSKITKSRTNSPVLKNLFVGRLDTNTLIFPEVFTKHELQSFDNEVLAPIERKLKELEQRNCDVKSYLEIIKGYGLFGQNIEEEYGGKNLNSTQMLRLSELTASNEPVSDILYNHNSLGIKCISMFGTEVQKQKYLPKLASGEWHIALCTTELNSGSDLSMVESTAKLSDDGTYYTLNGEKTWVHNAQDAHVFVTFAKTSLSTKQDQIEEKVSVFLVERDGLKVGAPYDVVGLKDVAAHTVTYENVKVPVDNVLGELGTGFQIAIQILHSDLFLKGSVYASILKTLSKQVVNHCIKRKQFGKSLKDFPLIQINETIDYTYKPKEKIANITVDIYTMESMSYVTAGIIDQYLSPDILCESAAVKVISSERLASGLMDIQQILGSLACTYNSPSSIAKHIDNARMNTIANSTNELLRLYIALNCLQHAGLQMQETVRKMRSPLYNLGFLFSESWNEMKTNRKNPVLTLQLHLHVHPDLSVCAESLEVRILKLKHLVTKYWTTYFNELQDQQLALKKFADIGMHAYAVVACLARATRSKAIGLQHADHEILIARSAALKFLKKIDFDMENLELGNHANGDAELKKIAEHVMKTGGYPPVHPLTRNW